MNQPEHDGILEVVEACPAGDDGGGRAVIGQVRTMKWLCLESSTKIVFKKKLIESKQCKLGYDEFITYTFCQHQI